jgi:predicted RNase H-like HicB family nuclease
MKRAIQFAIRRGERDDVAECLELPIVTQAPTLDELVRNSEESVALFLKDENLSELGLADRPIVLATLMLAPAA